MRFVQLAAIAVLLVGCDNASTATVERLKADGSPIVMQIEAYKSANGAYPKDLAAAGITLPNASFGGWVYAAYENETRFVLQIGDYREHDFVLFWDSRAGHWYLDT